MITPAALIAATQLRFRQRFYHDPNGTVRTVLADGRTVRLSAEQCEEVQAQYATACRPHHRALMYGFTATLPVILLTLVVLSRTGLSRAIDRLAIPGAASLAMILALTWWPLLALMLHRRSLRKVNTAIDAGLGSMPDAPPPPARPQNSQTVQIIALFVVGPTMLIDLLGSIFPNLFDHTPLMGRSIGLSTVIGLVLVIYLLRTRLAAAIYRWRQRQHACAATADPMRMTAIVRRARSPEG